MIHSKVEAGNPSDRLPYGHRTTRSYHRNIALLFLIILYYSGSKNCVKNEGKTLNIFPDGLAVNANSMSDARDEAWLSSPQRSSFSLSTVEDNEEDLDDVLLLPPPAVQSNHRRRSSQPMSDQTPLFSMANDKDKTARDHRSVLFGQTNLNWQRSNAQKTGTEKRDGFTGYFFGFMYEEPHPDDWMIASNENLPPWSRLNCFLSVAFALTTAAAATPIALIPTIALDVGDDSSFAARVAAASLTGGALGKLVTGFACDMLGARRVASVLGLLLSASLLVLSLSQGASTALWACFFADFFQSGQWPSVVVTLSSHSRFQPKGTYEQGLFTTSLASRFGSLIAIPLAALLLTNLHWRAVAHVAAILSTMGAGVTHLFITDSPLKVHDPQNPVSPATWKEFQVQMRASTSFLRSSMAVYNLVLSIIRTNLFPSLQTLFRSGRFWIVAIAHTAACMVRSSERLLGTYFRDTSLLSLTESRASGLAVSLSFGTLLGIAVAGSIFTRRDSHSRKQMVVRLYMCTIGGCYMLAILAIPKVRQLLAIPELILVFQVITAVVMGFGISVQSFQIPGLVGASFGNRKGLYAAYTDGIANGLGSIVWNVVGDAVQEGNPQGAGWFFGWSAVALLVVLCSILMVEFFEHYFVRADDKVPSSRPEGYETIIFV